MEMILVGILIYRTRALLSCIAREARARARARATTLELGRERTRQTGSKTGRAGTGFCGTLLRGMVHTAQPAWQRGRRPRAKAPPSACLLACL